MPSISLFSNEKDVSEFPAGHVLFRRGDEGDAMFVVIEGELDVVVGENIVETVGPGGLVGEMALIDHRARSADVVAKTPVKVAVVGQKRFLYLIQNAPMFAIEVMTIMVDRLRRTDDALIKALHAAD